MISVYGEPPDAWSALARVFASRAPAAPADVREPAPANHDCNRVLLLVFLVVMLAFVLLALPVVEPEVAARTCVLAVVMVADVPMLSESSAARVSVLALAMSMSMLAVIPLALPSVRDVVTSSAPAADVAVMSARLVELASDAARGSALASVMSTAATSAVAAGRALSTCAAAPALTPTSAVLLASHWWMRLTTCVVVTSCVADVLAAAVGADAPAAATDEMAPCPLAALLA